jgi:dinuclear metal center YbgI/SA1388 family protein
MVVHHPLLLSGVHSVATSTYKGALVHRLIRSGIALYVAHTNADHAKPGVSDALAERLGLVDIGPLVDGASHPGRTGSLPEPLSLGQFVAYAASRLPATVSGVRASGDPERRIATVAVSGGAGDGFLTDAAQRGVDAFLTADLRHHPASEHVGAGGPALLDAAHWATERPWLDVLARELRTDVAVEIIVSDLVTDVWTVHAGSASDARRKEPQP